MNVLVTGARGFIGSAFIRRLLTSPNLNPFGTITAFVRDTDSCNKSRLDNHYICEPAINSGKLRIVKGDLNGDISGLCENKQVVYNFAAKTFVDHSIKDPKPFIEANVLGTANLLEESRKQNVKAYFQISTDEVYGQILEGKHHEESPICPRNPYAASKAGGDALTISYAHTFGMWTCVTRTENNYGEYQHPQKAIPNFVGSALQDRPLTVYGDGKHVRQWLHVEDHVRALINLFTIGYEGDKVQSGEVFHVAGNQETTNTELALEILKRLNKSPELITYIDDHNIRPGHDRRYALTCEKIKEAIGWEPTYDLEEGLSLVVPWYKSNPFWTKSI